MKVDVIPTDLGGDAGAVGREYRGETHGGKGSGVWRVFNRIAAPLQVPVRGPVVSEVILGGPSPHPPPGRDAANQFRDVHVVFVLDVADNLFDNVFERNEA